MVLYGANTCTGGLKSTNCAKIARYPRLVSYNSEANVKIVKKAKPRRELCQNSKILVHISLHKMKQATRLFNKHRTDYMEACSLGSREHTGKQQAWMLLVLMAQREEEAGTHPC
jgi:hypothetical protein